MQKINLLYVITKLELGGAQKQLLLLVRHLDKNRYNLFLITAREGLLINELSSLKELKIKTIKSLERSINPIRDLFALFEIYHFIKRNKIDIVHTHSSKAGLLGRWAARWAGVNKIIHTVHGWSFNDYQNWFLRHFCIGLERLTAKITDRLIVVSHTDKQTGLKENIGELRKYILIHYGINFDEFKKDKVVVDKRKKELGLNSNLLVAMVACFKPQKAPLDFLRVAASIQENFPQLKFLLIGDGVLRKRIERTIEKFNLKESVILTGWRRDVPEVLSLIDVFVLTSLWEGLPIAVLEAMASGKPVVVTNTGGISEIVTHARNGFLVARGDVKAMKENIITLLKDKNLIYQIGERAKRSLNSEFSIENMIRRTQNLYNELISKEVRRCQLKY